MPDVTNVQVQVLTKAPVLGPEETEQFITFPIEAAMSGVPHVEEIRSLSQLGLSAITIVFEEGTDIFWARQQVGERLVVARDTIPAGVGIPELGPISTGLGEIYQFEVRALPGYEYSLMKLREILDWQVAYQLRSVPGVIEVNTFGGELKTYEVQLDPDKVINFKISIDRVLQALFGNNLNQGGGCTSCTMPSNGSCAAKDSSNHWTMSRGSSSMPGKGRRIIAISARLATDLSCGRVRSLATVG